MDADRFVLSIEVIDDDSESSMISVIVVDNTGSGSPPLSIIILIISGGFLSYSIFRDRNQKIQKFQMELILKRPKGSNYRDLYEFTIR